MAAADGGWISTSCFRIMASSHAQLRMARQRRAIEGLPCIR
jgi:hypothetical protein